MHAYTKHKLRRYVRTEYVTWSEWWRLANWSLYITPAGNNHACQRRLVMTFVECILNYRALCDVWFCWLSGLTWVVWVYFAAYGKCTLIRIGDQPPLHACYEAINSSVKIIIQDYIWCIDISNCCDIICGLVKMIRASHPPLTHTCTQRV